MKKYFILLLIVSNVVFATQIKLTGERFGLYKDKKNDAVGLYDNTRDLLVHIIHAKYGKMFIGAVHKSGRYIAVKDGYKIRVKKKYGGKFYETVNVSINRNKWVSDLHFDHNGLVVCGRSKNKSGFVRHTYCVIPYSMLNKLPS